MRQVMDLIDLTLRSIFIFALVTSLIYLKIKKRLKYFEVKIFGCLLLLYIIESIEIRLDQSFPKFW